MNITSIRTAAASALERIAANQPHSWADDIGTAAPRVTRTTPHPDPAGPSMSLATAGLITLTGTGAAAGSAYAAHKLLT